MDESEESAKGNFPVALLMQPSGKRFLQSQYVEAGRSSYDLARELGTYPNLIIRALRWHGLPVRTRSEAMKTGLQKGHFLPARQGLAHTEQTRKRIRDALTRRPDGTQEDAGRNE